MQKKYGRDGKFVVFLSYVQRYNEDAGKFLSENASNIPVYEQVRLPHAPCGQGIPHAVLFDHKGNVVATGFHEEFESKIEALVRAVPDPPPKILGGLEIKACTAQADLLAAGKPVDPVLKKLNEMALKDDDAGREAKQLAEAVKKFIEEEMARLKDASESAPVKTLVSLNSFANQVKGMPCEQEARNLIATLKKDKNVALIATSIQKCDAVQEKIAKNKKSSKADEKVIAKAKEDVRKMLAGGKLSEAVAKEANDFLQNY